MNTLRAIFEAIKAFFTWFEKATPTWDQDRQDKIVELKNRKAYWTNELETAQRERDYYIRNFLPTPVRLRNRIDKCVEEIVRCGDKLRALGSE
jgi:hypothetical protein